MRRVILTACLLGALAVPAGAQASQLIARDAKDVTLRVNARGEALVGYRAKGKQWTVLAWGAINALHPTPGQAQVAFRVDYSGGWGTYRKTLSRGFVNACRKYTGPQLPWFLTACTMPDGSHWALQSWQRGLPNLGLDPWEPLQASWELRLSHWSGDLPKLEIWTNWAYSRRFDHLFGRLTYLGQPAYGFAASAKGAPEDSFGRNIYLDTYNSAYGPGWKRENSFLAHRGTGRLLLRAVRARPVPRLSGGRQAPAGQGRALPGDGDRPGRPARRDLGGRRAGGVRRGARPSARRAAARRLRRRHALQAALIPVRSGSCPPLDRSRPSSSTWTAFSSTPSTCGTRYARS